MDTFLDAGKGEIISQIISQVIGHNYLLNLNDQDKLSKTLQKLKQLQGRQVILATATISRQMEQLIAHFWPDPPRLKQQNKFSSLIQSKTHYNLSNVKHQFIQIPETDKFSYLNLIMKEYQKYSKQNRNTSAIIFCNSIKSVRATEYFLAQNSIKASSLHGDIPPHKRVTEYNDFRQRKTRILVATDLAARGLDFPFVSHVINFDFPKSASDYLHRAGRTGRAGRFGQVVSLYRKRDLGLITQMRDSNELNKPLKIKGSAFSLKNKQDLIQTRLKDKNSKLSLPSEWRENKKLKQIRKKRQEKLQESKKSHSVMVAKGRFRGKQRIPEFKVKKKEVYQSKRIAKKVEVKNKRLASKWVSRNKRKLDYLNVKNSRKL